MSTDPPLALRALRRDDAERVRALVIREIANAPHCRGALSTLDAALAEPGDEYRALAAMDGERIVGIAVFGVTAGTEGAGRLHLVAVAGGSRRRRIGTSLVEATVDALRADGSRFVMVEIPDEPSLAAAKALLARSGFALEAKVPDYFRDGVPLTILRRSLR